MWRSGYAEKLWPAPGGAGSARESSCPSSLRDSCVSDLSFSILYPGFVPSCATQKQMDVVSGLPVVDPTNDKVVVGVITRSDLLKLTDYNVTVGQAMTAPPVVISPSFTIRKACEIMIAKKCHRVPVVDDDGHCVGVLSRTDLGGAISLGLRKELYSFPSRSLDAYEELVKRKLVAKSNKIMSGELISPTCPASAPSTWVVSYLYDGDCPICRNLKRLLESNDRKKKIWFVNISDPSYKAGEHMGVKYEDAMEHLHAIRRDGSISTGADALNELYRAAGMGWIANVSSVPGVSWLAKRAVDAVSAMRLPLMGKTFESLQALKRMEDEKNDDNHCSADTACELDWDDMYGDDEDDTSQLTEEERKLLEAAGALGNENTDKRRPF